MLFAGLPQRGWEAHWYTSLDELADPDKALVKWLGGAHVARGGGTALGNTVAWGARRREDCPTPGTDHFLREGCSKTLTRRPLPPTKRPSGKRSISGASTGPRAHAAISATSPLGAFSVIGP